LWYTKINLSQKIYFTQFIVVDSRFDIISAKLSFISILHKGRTGILYKLYNLHSGSQNLPTTPNTLNADPKIWTGFRKLEQNRGQALWRHINNCLLLSGSKSACSRIRLQNKFAIQYSLQSFWRPTGRVI
jgi:hypothetical protein